MFISSGDSLCIKELVSSIVLNECFGVEVAADNRLIMIYSPGASLFKSRLDCLSNNSPVLPFVHTVTINGCANLNVKRDPVLNEVIIGLREAIAYGEVLRLGWIPSIQ